MENPTGSESQPFFHTGSMDGHGEQLAASLAPFYAQMDSIPPRGGHVPEQHGGFGHPSSMQFMDMHALAHALPDPAHSPQHHPNHQHGGYAVGRGYSAQSPTSNGYNHAQMSHMGNPHAFRQSPFTGGMPHSSGSGHPPQHSPAYPVYGSYHPYASQLPPQSHNSAHIAAHYPGSYGRPDMFPQVSFQPYLGIDTRSFMPSPASAGEFTPQVGDAGTPLRYAGLEPTPSYPRGPPRKPKQSGHALWVGNLPPGTVVTALKDHFSREATDDIESLFLISKSNCAFVNYRTEAACSAAMARFHDSRFNGVRLVCRLRRGSVSPGTPSPPIQSNETLSLPPETHASTEKLPEKRPSDVVIASGSNLTPTTSDGADTQGSTTESPSRVPEKYFIVKSLTLQDLDSSVQNGVWATQSHNEAILNKAFESADNVYLIFSANKSGEYFGYARMLSPISGEAVAMHTQQQPQQQPEPIDSPTDGPKSIPTAATEWAPKGRIVDDSARGTIFWEADRSDTAEEAEAIKAQEQGGGDGQKQGQDWGKPFKIDWLSTNRLPFYRTRGLRNPWNANREVKIARDGTELEPGIGKRLVQMFHRPHMLPAGGMPQGVPPMQALFQQY